MLAFLGKAIKDLRVERGERLLEPAPQSVPPRGGPGSLALHLTARYLGRGPIPSGDGLAFDRWMAMVGNRIRTVVLLPAEDWIVLEADEWTKMTPPANAGTGATWEVDRAVATKLLEHFYPPTTNNEPDKNLIERQDLKATLLSPKDGITRVRLEGSLKMKRPFLHFQNDDSRVEASFVGYLDYDAAKKEVRSFRMVTDKATYARGDFGVAVRSVP